MFVYMFYDFIKKLKPVHHSHVKFNLSFIHVVFLLAASAALQCRHLHCSCATFVYHRHLILSCWDSDARSFKVEDTSLYIVNVKYPVIYICL